MLSKKLFLTLAIFVMCFGGIFGFTSYAAESIESDSPDAKQPLIYSDYLSESDDGRYIYMTLDNYIIRYDSIKNKVKKLKKLPAGRDGRCMLMGDYLVIEMSVRDEDIDFFSDTSDKIYTYNLKTKELKLIADDVQMYGVNKNKDIIYLYKPNIGEQAIDVEGNILSVSNHAYSRERYSFIKRKKKGVSIKEEKPYYGSYETVRKKTKTGKYKYVTRYKKKWTADKNHIVLKIKGKKKKILAKNAFISSSICYFDNCAVIKYHQYSKYLYHYNYLSEGIGVYHMMIVKYDGKVKKIY